MSLNSAGSTSPKCHSCIPLPGAFTTGKPPVFLCSVAFSVAIFGRDSGRSISDQENSRHIVLEWYPLNSDELIPEKFH